MDEHPSALSQTKDALETSALTKKTSEITYGVDQCPRCGGRMIDVAQKFCGWKDRAGTVLLRFPVGCRLCGHRFALSLLSGDVEIVVPRNLATRAAIILLGALAAIFWIGLKIGSF